MFGSEGLLDEIKKALAERMLNPELDEHLAAESAEADSAASAGNAMVAMARKLSILLLSIWRHETEFRPAG